MTGEQKQEEQMRFLRTIRNNKLEASDVFMRQFDRFSQKQMEQLTAYRQALRDLPNQNQHEFPPEPDFIQKTYKQSVRPGIKNMVRLSLSERLFPRRNESP
jgi:hypothetical protein